MKGGVTGGFTGNGANKRLVLGFDAGCTACVDLAARVGELVGEKVDIRDLSEPRVEHLRKQALGKDAPWTPTLIEISPDGAKAWTGTRMAVRLGRSVGFLSAWRILRALGEVTEARKTDISHRPASVGMSRGQFLKGVGSTAVAMSVLVGTTAKPSAAATDSSGMTTGVTPTEMTEAQMQQVFHRESSCKRLHRVLTGKGFSSDKRMGYSMAASGQSGNCMAMFYRQQGSDGLTATLIFYRVGNRARADYSIIGGDGRIVESRIITQQGNRQSARVEQNAEALRRQTQDQIEAAGGQFTTQQVACSTCIPLAGAVLNAGCGVGATVIAAAACGPAALACAAAVGTLQATACYFLTYPVSREALCREAGFC
jgi:hypothetical protein